MIRYPKRNVGQPKKPARPQIEPEGVPQLEVKVEPTQTELVSLPSPPPPPPQTLPALCGPAKWAEVLYPSKLWNLHQDLDYYTYRRHTMSKEEREVMEERLPPSTMMAESVADKLLDDFVVAAIERMGTQSYYSLLQQAMTDNAKIMLALRCLIASSVEYSQSKITIYRNKVMNSADFFPQNQWESMKDPQTGETIQVAKAEEGYERSEKFNSRKHQVLIEFFISPPITDRDKMPTDVAGQMKLVLEGYGISIDDPNKIWDKLSQQSQISSIEERIVARIAYLIMNSAFRKKPPQTPLLDNKIKD